MDYHTSNHTQAINPYAVNVGSSLTGYSPWLFLQSPAFSDVSLPSDDTYRSQSAPPCLEQGHPFFSSSFPLHPLFSDPSAFSLSAPKRDEFPAKEHIPRPPNAFMLYRSHMLKNRGNAEPEKRQQNLSRIAGQLWREMSDEDKAVWHDKAAEVYAAHCAKYPHYKFKPNRKGIKSGVKTPKSRTYCQPTQQFIAESSMGPVRRARSRRRAYPKGLSHEDLLGTLQAQFPSSVASSPGLSPLRLPSMLPVFSANENPTAMFSQPQPQSVNALGLELGVSRPPTPDLAELLSELAHDLDATPTAATFKHRDGNNIPQPENALSQDSEFLGLEQLRLPYFSAAYSPNCLSPSVHAPANDFQPCSELGGAPPCASGFTLPDFEFSASMPLGQCEGYEDDMWSDVSWMLASDLDSKLNM